ncbi:Pro-Pol poly [Paramuricea clavata]|uniref:Pro-Pol poly n=1 Tax=Paramuricea clavata TaxID=317549 RepID=A0A6S7LFS5_PARCT|nr:Pro-Pol poly [Paramuricea clavata]
MTGSHFDIQLHGFGDSSNQGVSAVVYALAKQDSGDTQRLVAAKSRLAKRGLTIPRLEFVVGHMTENLVSNVAKAIGEERVSQQHAWIDSTVGLYWIRGMGEYRQFVANRVIKIQAHSNIEWHHVPTSENPADIGSRGGQPTEKWLNSPTLTRGVHLELLKSLETEDFLQSFKRVIARQGRPSVVYSDNEAIFKAAVTLLRKVWKEEKFYEALCKLEIVWRFNLAKAPLWGGQYERLIGIFKSMFRKTIAGGLLSFSELEEIVLDVEVCMNNRSLTYLEDDPQLLVFTPNSFLFQRPTAVPELQPHQLKEQDLKKRLRFLCTTKDGLWNRWTREYLTGLRERHKIVRGSKAEYPKVGDVLIVKGENKNRNTWKLGKIVRLITGRDGVVRGVELHTGNGRLERPLKLIYPLELHWDQEAVERETPPLNAQAKEFRPKRKAAKNAAANINKVLAEKRRR